jgi:ATP-binding cassette subfamily B (MDR/TAP) protein 1
MVLGLVGAVGDGLSTPMMLFLANRIFNDIATGPDRLLQFTS